VQRIIKFGANAFVEIMNVNVVDSKSLNFQQEFREGERWLILQMMQFLLLKWVN